MRKPLAALLALCLLFLLPSCADDVAETPPGPPVPEIPEDYVYLASENVFSTYTPNGWLADIPLITGATFSPDEVEVWLDQTPLKPAVLDEEGYELSRGYVVGTPRPITMPFYVYQIYRGKDWAEYTETILAAHNASFSNLSGSIDAQNASREEFLPDYLQLEEEGRLPVLYYSAIVLEAPEENPPSEAHFITIRLNGRKLTFPFGEVKLGEAPPNPPADIQGFTSYFEYGNGIQSFRATGELIPVNSYHWKDHRAAQDVTVTGIKLWNDSREISDIRTIITKPYADGEKPLTDGTAFLAEDVVADFYWDGTSPIELKKGQYISFEFNLHEPRLANKLTGYTQFYLQISYRCADGAESYILIYYMLDIEPLGLDPHQIYLDHELGIDVLKYYTDYYNALNLDWQKMLQRMRNRRRRL